MKQIKKPLSYVDNAKSLTQLKKPLSYVDNAKSLTQLKKQDGYFWLKEINSQSMQFSLKNLDNAYKNFFKKKAKFPRFKSRHRKDSFCVPQFVRVEGDNLIIPKFKDPIKIILHRGFEVEVRQCTIPKTSTNEYFVSILVETKHKSYHKTGERIGIDIGLKDFVITSEGEKYKNNRYTKKYAKKLKSAQQDLSRKQKGSNRYNRQKLKVARLHKKITNSRNDNLHKVSTDLVKRYDIIFMEDLNIKGMMKNHRLSKHIADDSWGKFMEMLLYKAEWNGKQIVKIDRFYPSSKTCHICGHINKGLKLNDREWVCPVCKAKHDRNLNAAINILIEGVKIISTGTVDNRRGDEIRPSKLGTIRETPKVLV